MDQTTDYLQIPSGSCRFTKNFEPKVSGGYSRIPGYERFDGQPKPHEQTYYLLQVADATVITSGDTITGVTSGATSTCIGVDTRDNTIGVAKVTGAYVDGESLTTTTLIEYLGPNLGAVDLDDQWALNAQDLYRADILAVPGSGPVRGVHKLRATLYAFRDNVGGTALDVYRTTASGWELVTLPNIILFHTGIGPGFEIGDTVTGASSGASAEVLNYVKYAGSWSTDAAGYIVLGPVTSGPFLDTELLQVLGVTQATADGANYQYTMLPGGDFRIKSYNFYATLSGYMMYGVDGVNPAFEYDGTAFTPILLPGVTGVPEANAPTLLVNHKGHLFTMFANGLVQHSVQGEPTVYVGFLGAGEFGLGSEGTALMSEDGGVLVLRTARETYGIYGNTVADWELKKLSSYGGSIIHTSEQFGDIISFDDKGIVLQSRTQKFGDFEAGTISRKIQPLVDTMVPYLTRSVLVRGKNQYRVFASDNTFIITYLKEDGSADFMYGEYLTDVTCVTNTNDDTVTEEIYFGSSDGFVYQAEVGRNFDGEEIEAYIQMPFIHSKSPNHRKRYRRVFVDLDATSAVTLRISAELDYGDPYALEPLIKAHSIAGGVGGTWDVDNWEQVFWDLQTLHFVRYDMTGSGANFALTFYNKSAITDVFTLQAVRVDYELRRKER